MVSFGATPGGERRRVDVADVVDVAVEAAVLWRGREGRSASTAGLTAWRWADLLLGGLAMGGLAVGRVLMRMLWECVWSSQNISIKWDFQSRLFFSPTISYSCQWNNLGI